MPTVIQSEESPSVWAPPAAKPLDRAAWQVWIAQGREQDRRDGALWMKAVKCVSIAALVAAAGLWSQFVTFELVVRLVVAAGAMLVMVQAFRAKSYSVAAVFVVLALLYNPVAPAFQLAGSWQRVAVMASAVPFAVSLAWPNTRKDEIR